MKNSLIVTLLLFIGFTTARGQETEEKGKSKVEVISLDKLSYKKIDGKKVRILVGNVAFKKDNVIFTCDSAIQYIEEQTIYAYENVKFNQGDTLKLTGDELVYDELEESATVTGDLVTMTDGKMNLRTTSLFYNMGDEIAYYTDSAYITDADNILHSIKGYYYARTKDMYFKKRVRLNNPEYKIRTDTLRYNVSSENSYFIGPSHIYTVDGDYLYCENGIFLSQGKEVKLGKKSLLRSEGQLLTGDSLYYNSETGQGYAYKRARLIDSAKNLEVIGNYAAYNKIDDSYLITDSLMMIQYDETDTTYLTSDTLKLFYDSTKTKRIALAYYHVKIFSNSYQAACDSMAYHSSDSLIDYFGSPVIWMDSFQITADDIRLTLKDDNIDRVWLKNNSIMGQKHPYKQYDQIQGDSMTAFFNEGKIRRIDVHSAAKAIYYLLEGDTALLGANNISSKRAVIRFGENNIKKISFIEQGESDVIPAKSVNPAQLILSGFSWRGDERPYSPEGVYKRKVVVEKAVTESSKESTDKDDPSPLKE